jgi:hypothetical protein
MRLVALSVSFRLSKQLLMTWMPMRALLALLSREQTHLSKFAQIAVMTGKIALVIAVMMTSQRMMTRMTMTNKPFMTKENAWNIMDLAGYVKSSLPDNNLNHEAVSETDLVWFIQSLESVAFTANRIAKELRDGLQAPKG